MMKVRGIRILLVGCVFAVAALPVAASSTALAAPADHVFDPQLSLTGGCTTNEDDPVPDPGCPYPPPPGGPSESFNRTTGMAIDSYGDVYVVSPGPEGKNKAYIDIFDPEGFFISELHLVNPTEPLSGLDPRTVAVDSKGYLYVYSNNAGVALLRYDPDPAVYDPAAGEIGYKPTPTVLYENGTDYASLAVNPEDDHLFVNFGTFAVINGEFDRSAIIEFGSGEDTSPLLDKEVAEVCCTDGPGLAIDASRDRLYATDDETVSSPRVIQVFELAAPHALIETIDGSSTPAGSFPTGPIGPISIAVDEATGNLFVYEQERAKKVIYELTEDGDYLATIEHNLQAKEKKNQVVVDNGANSPNGALSLEGRYLWATAAPPGVGHAYAFKQTHVTPPGVESISVSEVSENEAQLEAEIDPGQAETAYRFEYLSKTQFEAAGFAGATVAGQGTIPAGTVSVSISAEATGLSPGTAYVFRVVATNEAGEDEDEGEFKTYSAIIFGPCPNDALRIGSSAALPDCRAYELVTPSDTAGRPPLGMGLQSLQFPSLPASPDGNRLSFRIENGLIPGLDATSSLSGDPYLTTRGAEGWETVATGPHGTEAGAAAPGGRSPDQTYSAWGAEISGPAVIGGERTIYVRYPDGHSELFGRGSLGVDPNLSGDPKAGPKLISADGAHMLFASTVRLENAAQPTGKFTVYDRTADEVTHVVSLLPGDKTPSGSQRVEYLGASFDGRGVAFAVSEGIGNRTLYLRYENQTTYEIGEGLTFEGIAEGGGRIFYLKAGSLFAFDVASGKTIPFATSGNVTVVNVSADGSTAYLVSQSKLTSTPNPLGDKALAGSENLYRSREGSISFLGTVSEEDVAGHGANIIHDGLGLWVEAVGGKGSASPGAFAIDPSRSIADGSVLLFQSTADLTAYDSEGTRQIYRYDSIANELTCLSCNPTGIPASGDALLQNVTEEVTFPEPNTGYDLVTNLSAGGRRAFFQSPDPLVAADTDGLQDVYEWESQGVGSCTDPGGCLYLISSGHSGKLNYLYAAGANGDDVFFRTSDILAPADREAIPSIYDARVDGGFPPPVEAGACEGEGCRPQLTPPPVLPTPRSSPGRSGNVSPKCPKGKRKVTRHGKVRCAKKKKHHRHKRNSGTGKKGATK
jgi:hypothetical protein